MSAWEDELARFDWASLACACGLSGAHLTLAVSRLMAGSYSASEARDFYRAAVENHAVVQSVAFEPAVALTSVLAAAVGEAGDPMLRAVAYLAFLSIISCDGQAPPFDGDLPPLVAESRAIILRAKEELYRDLRETKSPTALNVLEYCEDDDERLKSTYAMIRTELPPPYSAPEYRLFARRDKGW